MEHTVDMSDFWCTLTMPKANYLQRYTLQKLAKICSDDLVDGKCNGLIADSTPADFKAKSLVQ